jgi:hypothetical protein
MGEKWRTWGFIVFLTLALLFVTFLVVPCSRGILYDITIRFVCSSVNFVRRLPARVHNPAGMMLNLYEGFPPMATHLVIINGLRDLRLEGDCKVLC